MVRVTDERASIHLMCPTLTLALLLVAPALQEPAATKPVRPNILLLFADDQRSDSLGAYGNEHARTPVIDALAARGFTFRSNYCFGSIHGAVCQPSRAMLLSGRTLWRVPMDLKGVTTLPMALRAAGYETFLSGKWHNGEASAVRGFERGGAIFFGGMCDHTKVPVRDLADGALGPKRVGAAFSSELFADATIDFLKGRDRARPFFAMVAFTAAHDPRQPPEPYRSQAYEDLPPLPKNFLPQHPFDNGWLVGRDENLLPWPRPEAMVRQQLAEYQGLVRHLDAQVGRIVATLDALGLTENTLVVYTADHGLALGSHGLLGKQSVYEHSMGCPLIVAGPGVPRGESAALTYLLDLCPTLCEVGGVDVPAGVEGASLASVWRGERAGVRDSLYLAYENVQRSVRDARFKLTRYPHIDFEQLFDLQADPDERHDLREDPGHAEDAARLRGELERWHARVDDPHPLRVDEPKPRAIDLTGRARKPDQWQPAWIVEKYFGAGATTGRR